MNVERTDLRDILAISAVLTVIVLLVVPYAYGRKRYAMQVNDGFIDAPDTAPRRFVMHQPAPQRVIVEKVDPPVFPESMFTQYNTDLIDVIGAKPKIIGNYL